MADLVHYALRVWHEDLDQIRDELDEFGFHHTNEVFEHARSMPDGISVLVLDINADDKQDLVGVGGMTLEVFNHSYEWRDRDDTIGLFTKMHLK